MTPILSRTGMLRTRPNNCQAFGFNHQRWCFMDLDGIRILIVEDEPLIALDAGLLIVASGGIIAGIARSLGEAREAIKMPGFDCVMLDVNLGGVLAFEIAHDLENHGVPFFFCTAYKEPFPGFEHHPQVSKPFNKETIANAVLSL